MPKCSYCNEVVTKAQINNRVGEKIMCNFCTDDLEGGAAAEMGVEDYYEMTGDLPGDK